MKGIIESSEQINDLNAKKKKMEARNESLAGRIEKLENSNRRLKLLALAALALLALGATQNQDNQGISNLIQAKSFQVVSGNGKVLIDIGTFGDFKHPAILIYDGKEIGLWGSFIRPQWYGANRLPCSRIGNFRGEQWALRL